MRIRLIAIFFSIIVASLTLCNLFTVTTHAIDFELPKPEEMKITIDPVNKDLVLLGNFAVNNNGAYDINDIDINAKLLNENDLELMSYSQKDLAVLRGTNKDFDLIVSLDVDKVPLLDWFSLIYEDTTFKLLLDIDASYMYNLIDVTVDEAIEFPWISPLTNFTENKTALEGIETIISIASNNSIASQEEYEKIMDLLAIESYYNSYKDIYEINIDVNSIDEKYKEIDTKITFKFPIIDYDITLFFKTKICTLFTNFNLNIEEVNISFLD